MLKVSGSKKGFTLIELMVVAIIVAILAVVAIPMMRGNTRRAIATEAESALGSLRSAMRAYYAEHGTYDGSDTAATTDNITTGAVVGKATGNVPGFVARVGTTTPGDLDGTYFSQECYTITAIAAQTYTIQCTWNSSVGTGGWTTRFAEVNTTGNTTAINELGTITRTGY